MLSEAATCSCWRPLGTASAGAAPSWRRRRTAPKGEWEREKGESIRGGGKGRQHLEGSGRGREYEREGEGIGGE